MGENSDLLTFVPQIGPWIASTISASNLDLVEKSYKEWFNYSVVDRGTISEELAHSWGAPKVQGSKYCSLVPESGKEVLIRIVENPAPENFEPLTTFGWAATELVVKDVDKLAKHLENSPFKIIGPPADLELVPQIRAMQVVGLAQEVFYLTMFKEDIPEYDLPTAHSFIDRMFIAVMASNSPSVVQNWYNKNFQIPVGNIADIKLDLLDNAFKVPPRSGDYQLTVVTLRGRSLIEVDGYPSAAKPRFEVDGFLPPSNSIMSVLVDSIDTIIENSISQPIRIAQTPYHGRRSITVKGSMDELIEFIEREAS